MINFILGIIASIVATVVCYSASASFAHRRMSNLKGYWFQEIPEFEGRNYSIGQFSYNKYNRNFSFDGTNYDLDGKPLCDWESISLHADFSARKILYTFKGNVRNKGHSQFYGFGVMTIETDQSGTPIPTKGFFQDAQEAATPMSFTVKKLDEVAKDIGIMQGDKDIESYHSDLVAKYSALHKSV